MKSGFQFFALILSLLISYSLFAQNKTSYNSRYVPLNLVKRLSYENFRNIRLLQAAIMNFGGGKKELGQLVDQYAEASALYFQNRIDAAANKFEENNKKILETAKKVVRAYKRDAEKILLNATKYNIKTRLSMEIKGVKRHKAPDKYLSLAKYSLRKANDFFVRYKDAISTDPRQLARAIYYFRRAKENSFIAYKAYFKMGTRFERLVRLERQKKLTDQQRDELKRKRFVTALLKNYEKDMQDNLNKQYTSKEKKN